MQLVKKKSKIAKENHLTVLDSIFRVGLCSVFFLKLQSLAINPVWAQNLLHMVTPHDLLFFLKMGPGVPQ